MTTIYKAGNTTKLKEYIGEDLYARQRSSRHVCIPVKTNAYFLAFYWCDIKNTQKNDERLCVYCSNTELVLFGNHPRYAEIQKPLSDIESPFCALADFFSELTAKDVDELEHLENVINELEGSFITTDKPVMGVSARIIELRSSLLKMKRYYEQLDIVLDQLVENENKSIPPESLGRLTALNRRIHYLAKSVMDLRDYVTQVREAYQAKVDIEQNQIMKIFTVIAAVFLPLTLIVGWYGMNFHMPEYTWRFGYLYVIILSVLVCAVCYIIFKRKKWF